MKKILLSLLALIATMQLSAQTYTAEMLDGKTFEVVSSEGEFKFDPNLGWYDAMGIGHEANIYDAYGNRIKPTVNEITKLGLVYKTRALNGLSFAPQVFIYSDDDDNSYSISESQSGVMLMGKNPNKEKIVQSLSNELSLESISDEDYNRLIAPLFLSFGEPILSYSVANNVLTLIIGDDYSVRFKIESLTENEMTISQLNPKGFKARLALKTNATTNIGSAPALPAVKSTRYSVDGRRATSSTRDVVIENGAKHIER